MCFLECFKNVSVISFSCFRPHTTAQEAPKRPKSFKQIQGKSLFFAFSPFRFRWPSEASRWLQDGPRGPQEGPKRAPRWPQERPRAPQDRLKRDPRGDLRRSRGAKLIGSTLFFDRSPPRWPQEAPGRPREAPKWPQHGHKMAPRGPQEQDRPKALCRSPALGLKTVDSVCSLFPGAWNQNCGEFASRCW